MVTSEDVKKQYSPATPTSEFPFPIAYFTESDINVIYTVGAVDTELVLNAASAGFTVSPVNGNPEYGATIDTTETYTDGVTITIYRDVPITNESDFVRGGDVSPEIMNEVNDRGTAVDQQINEEISLSFKAPVSDPDGLDYTVGNVEARKNKALGFKDDGGITALNLSLTGTIGVDNTAGLELSNNIISGVVDDSTVGFNSNGEFEVKTVTDNELADNTISGNKLADSTVTLQKMADVSNYTVLGNVSGVSDAPAEVDIIDDDSMDTAEATNLASAESIKEYIGIWQDWTPIINQGTALDIAHTSVYSRYVQIGQTVIVKCLLEITGAGSTGEITIEGLPVAATASLSAYGSAGVGNVVNSSVGTYPGQVEFTGTNSVNFAGWALLSPIEFILAAPDRITFTLTYEAD